MKVFILAVLGALAAILANRGIAVFNDGLRPILPEFLEGRMNRKALAATSFAMSFGLVVGFGIPISIAATIILIHSVLLATDIIGTWCPDGMKGTVLAGIFGGLWGGGIAVGLEFIVDLCKLLSVNFLPPLRQVGVPVVAVFCAFPALTVAYQYGFKKGGTNCSGAGTGLHPARSHDGDCHRCVQPHRHDLYFCPGHRFDR